MQLETGKVRDQATTFSVAAAHDAAAVQLVLAGVCHFEGALRHAIRGLDCKNIRVATSLERRRARGGAEAKPTESQQEGGVKRAGCRVLVQNVGLFVTVISL